MLIPFSLISNWGYKEINNKNEMGVTPGYCLDIFGVNLLAQVVYSFTNKGLWIFWLIPLYAIYSISGYIK